MRGAAIAQSGGRRVASLLALLATAATASPAAPPPSASFDALRGDRAFGWTGQTRSEMLARHGMVATSQPLAAEAGLDILKAGGNAFDAAVATAAALNVVEPYSAGIGGDLFMIAWVAREHRLVALDGSGRAPSGDAPERFRARGLAHIPDGGIDAAVTPGAVDAWDVALRRYGTMDFARTLEPARRLADEGFGVSERIAGEWQLYADALRHDPESTRVYLPGGRAPAPYQLFRNPDLASAFRLLERDGRNAFYDGPIGRALVARSRALGGGFTMADLARIHAAWVTPLTTRYRGYDIYEMPPPTQGFAVLEQLNLIEQCAPGLGVRLTAGANRTPGFWHMLIETKKRAYSDLARWNGDPDYSRVPTARLTSKAYAETLCAGIDPRRASVPSVAARETGGTVYLSVADRDGNIVSMIYSIYDEFGSGVTVPGYGFLLNDRGAGFSLDPSSPNVIAPGKRPFYTIIPAFVARDGEPRMAFGVMSGDQQAQGQVQVLVNMLDLGANPQAASDAARFNHSQSENRIELESQLYDAVGPALRAMGHDARRANGLLMGGYQAIAVDPATRLLRGASDHRKDGAAVGY